jgi:hypothetical protein
VVAAVAHVLSAKSSHPFPKSRNISDTFEGGVFGDLEILNAKMNHVLNKLFWQTNKNMLYIYINND